MRPAMKIASRLVLAVGMLCALGFGYLSWRVANPSVQNLPLAESLISFESDEGRVLVGRAVERADLDLLDVHFEAQQYASYCGVASGVIALNALGTQPAPVSQETFFDGVAADVRGAWSTFYGGMTLEQLGGLLAAHRAHVEVVHAGDVTLDEFRTAARRNLSRAGDFVLVNYLRSVVGQRSGGHISPIAAYDAETDRFLVLDVSTYKYPWVWVKAEALFDAMNTADSGSGKTRGYVFVAARG